MPTYVVLANWTPQGGQTVKQGPDRLNATRKLFEKAGGKLKDFYLVMGRYDLIFIVEAPDDTAVAKTVLTLATQGNIRSETCRAFTEQEARQIVAGLP